MMAGSAGMNEAASLRVESLPPLILLVDDDAAIRFLLTRALNREGFRVAELEDGASVLSTMRQLKPDLVLLDVLMPGMDGFTVCREIRGPGGYIDLPVLIMTGLEDTESIDAAYAAGATDFITKPINLGILGYRVRYLLRASRDLSARREAEERYRRSAQRLKLSNDELKAFAYIIAHDLREPLVNIKGFAGELGHSLRELLGTYCPVMPETGSLGSVGRLENMHAEVNEYLAYIDGAAVRMDRLLSAIARLSHLGNRELKPEPLDMTALVSNVVAAIASRSRPGTTEISLGAMPEVIADRSSMEEVVRCLLENALAYLQPDRPGSVAIWSEKDSVGTTFHIRDNGRGIATEDHGKVFDIFRRSGRQEGEGLGMGLAYVKALIRRHGGSIWCRSEPGNGSTFSFTIPHEIEDLL